MRGYEINAGDRRRTSWKRAMWLANQRAPRRGRQRVRKVGINTWLIQDIDTAPTV